MSDRYRDRDDEEEELDLEDAEPPKRRGRLLAALIALFAIGGFGGVLWYAYSQGQRSADAVAPILKSDGEPSRVKPEQPGGMSVPHQDKLVLNSMQQSSRPNPQAERLLPPAEAPLPQTTRTAPPPAASVTLAPVAPPPAPAPTPSPAPQAAVPAIPTPIPPPPPATTTGSLIAPPAPPPVAPAPSSSAPPPSPPPVAAATPPAPPPPQMAARPPSPPSAAAAAAPRAGGAGGEWRIQLGSFPAVEQASAQWDRLKKAHAELQPLGLTTVRVDLPGKGVWYRLQAGPLNEAGARTLCEDLKSKKRDCLVVRP